MRLVTTLAARAVGAISGAPVLVWPLVASVAAAGWGQWQVRGLRVDLAELRRAVAEADRAAALRSEAQGRAALVAAGQYAAWRAAEEGRDAETRTALRNALSGPIACPARAADVLVPAAAVSRLRDAGTSDAPGGAAATSGGAGR